MSDKELILECIKAMPGQRPAVISTTSGVNMNIVKYFLPRMAKEGLIFCEKANGGGKHWYITGSRTIGQRVSDVLREADEPLHYRQVAARAGIEGSQASQSLFRLKNRGEIVKVGTITLLNNDSALYKHQSNMPPSSPLESSAASLHMPIETYTRVEDTSVFCDPYMRKFCHVFYGTV